jgi:hypothetical protein
VEQWRLGEGADPPLVRYILAEVASAFDRLDKQQQTTMRPTE